MPLGIQDKSTGNYYYGPERWGPDQELARTFASTVVPAAHLIDELEKEAAAKNIPEDKWRAYYEEHQTKYHLTELH